MKAAAQQHTAQHSTAQQSTASLHQHSIACLDSSRWVHLRVERSTTRMQAAAQQQIAQHSTIRQQQVHLLGWVPFKDASSTACMTVAQPNGTKQQVGQQQVSSIQS
jgi:hypothetical protein